ncbi:MAG: nuclear transport factor 2 family protein [Pyrinomonadaceae bacterium]
MKRLLALIILIAAASSIAIVRSANKSESLNQDAIIAQEKLIAEALKKKDVKSFNNLIASDAVLLGPQGRTPVADFTKFAFDPDYKFLSVTIEDAQVKMINPDAALLTYKSTSIETYQGSKRTSNSYTATLWAKRGGKWVAVFHQRTLINEPTIEAEQ